MFSKDREKQMLATQKLADRLLNASRKHNATVPQLMDALGLIASRTADSYPQECYAEDTLNMAAVALFTAANATRERENREAKRLA